MVFNLLKIIRERASSYIWLKIHTSGIARAFGIQKNVPYWSEVWEDTMSKITPFNQRDIPACVAHATVTSMQIEWYRRTGKIINFSPRFLDILSWTENLGLHDGRDPAMVMALAVNVGCCTEDLLLNDTTLPVEEYRDRNIITKTMMKEASKYRLSNLLLSYEILFDNWKKN